MIKKDSYKNLLYLWIERYESELIGMIRDWNNS